MGRSTDRRHKTSRDETFPRRSREESWRDKTRDRWAGVVVAHPPGPWAETTSSGRHGLAISVPRDLRPSSVWPGHLRKNHSVMGASLVCLGSRSASSHLDGRRVSLMSPLGEGDSGGSSLSSWASAGGAESSRACWRDKVYWCVLFLVSQKRHFCSSVGREFIHTRHSLLVVNLTQMREIGRLGKC
jgi:hypothetical protein